MSPEETRHWAYTPELELSDQDEDDFILVNGDWPTLLQCAADSLCPKADFIESALSTAVTEMVRGRRGSDVLYKLDAATQCLPATCLLHLRQSLMLYRLWQSPRPLSQHECDDLAKALLMWTDAPLTRFNKTGHIFNNYIEYSKHSSYSGLVFLYIEPETSHWIYGRSSRYPDLPPAFEGNV